MSKKIIINVNEKCQKWEGFGTSLMWWANAIEGFEQIPASETGKQKGFKNRYEELMYLLFDPEEGLGINIVRYNVGGGDNEKLDFINRTGARIPGYLMENGQYDWEADYMQVKVLKDAYKIIKKTQQSFYNTVFSVSAPYFMTYSGSSTGSKNATDDNLRWDCYENFVNYFLNVVSYIRDIVGIPVTDIEPVNEPTSGYWRYGSQKQEGCQFNRVTQPERHLKYYYAEKDLYDPKKFSALSKIYEIVGKELQKRQKEGKLVGITICGTDETSIDAAALSFLSLTEEAKGYISKITTHEYEGTKRNELSEIARKYNKKIWMSEITYSGGKWNPEAMDKGCFQLSGDIQRDIYELGVSAWIGWQGIESLGENLLWDSNWGFIHCLFEEPVWEEKSEKESEKVLCKEEQKNCYKMRKRQYCIDSEHCLTPEEIQRRGLHRGDYFLTKQYYVWGQYTKFLKENYQIIKTPEGNLVAAVSPEKDTIILIVTNEENVSREHLIEFQNISKIVSVTGLRTSETEKWEKIEAKIMETGIAFVAAEKSVSSYKIKLLQ